MALILLTVSNSQIQSFADAKSITYEQTPTYIAEDISIPEEESQQVEEIEEADHVPIFYIESVPLDYNTQEYIYETCDMDIDKYAMILAIAYNESRFTPSAIGINVNGTNDWGLCQLNDTTRRFLMRETGITNMRELLDVKTNIRAAVVVLNYHYKATGSLNSALLRYQVGEGSYARMIARGRYTTKTHQKVLGYYNDYVRELEALNNNSRQIV